MSGLAGFRYLKRRRITTLVLILTLASALFSMMAFSLVGFYGGFIAYMGGGEDIVVLYDKGSSTPFTGLVPAYLAERIGVLEGVLASSPEAIAPCIIDGRAVFVRGVVPKEFAKLTKLKIMDGEMLQLNDTYSMIVGKRLARTLGLKPGDKVLVFSVLRDQYVELHVKGVYESGSVMDDEALAPLYVGQWLRGADYGHVTLIRFRIDKGAISPVRIFDEVAKEAEEPAPGRGEPSQQQPPGQPIIPRITARFTVERIGVEEAQRFMKSYMERYGVTREALITLSALVFLFSGTSIVAASRSIVAQHRGEIEVLRSIGASKKLVKRDLLVKLLPWSIVSSSAGVTAASVVMVFIHENGYLQVLSHTVQFQPDPLIIAINFILSIVLVALGVIRSELG